MEQVRTSTLAIAVLATPDGNFQPITEKELCDALRNGVVQQMTFRRQINGGYYITCALTWRLGDCILATRRGHPRRLANLDRAVAKFDLVWVTAPPISLVL